MDRCSVDGCDKGADVKGRKLCYTHYSRWRRTGSVELGAKPRLPIADRFWRMVDRRGARECWPWLGALTPHGYGAFSPAGRTSSTRAAYRVSWELANGKLPKMFEGSRAVVRHTCDNPACVNPKHLVIGNQRLNVRDMDERGRRRHPKGEEHQRAKLTADDVRAIRASTESSRKLAEKYGVGRGTIRAIIYRINWKHID